jgi:hypothetical protein
LGYVLRLPSSEEHNPMITSITILTAIVLFVLVDTYESDRR